MRMIALAQAWQLRGGMAHLASMELPERLRERLADEGIASHSIDADTQGSKHDAAATASLATDLLANRVIADGYRFGADYQQAVQTADRRLAVVTDYDYCSGWKCDWVVNQNPHAVDENYEGIESKNRRLLGTRFALLRREFLDADVHPADIRSGKAGTGPRLLITLGGSDPDNLTGRLLRVLEHPSDVTERLEVRLLVGAANPHGTDLQELAQRSRHRIELLTNVTDMPAQYAWADGLIGAGGSSCWEWMYAGLAAAILVIADNQQPIYDHLVEQQIAVGLGQSKHWNDRRIQTKLSHFLETLSTRAREPGRFRNRVDGFGAARVAAALDSGVWLRPALDSDVRQYFDWANDPIVRRQSLTTETINWSAHCDWFEGQLRSADARLYVAISDDRPVGQIRFNRDTDGQWVVSFSVAEEARGKGIGKQLLVLGTSHMRAATNPSFLATVRRENIASANCFLRLGWSSITPPNDQVMLFRQTLPQ